MMFSEWKSKPVEVRTLFNPMFCAFVLDASVAAYSKENDKGMQLPLLFLVLPLVLHSKTRSILPKAKSSNLGLWSKDNENDLLMLAKRVSSLNRTTLQSLALLQMNSHVEIQGSRILHSKKMNGVTSYLNLSEEIKEIHAKSQFVGRWFANSGDVAAIYTYLGIRP